MCTLSVTMSKKTNEPATAGSETEKVYKLEKGSEDLNLFHSLIETLPDFLNGLTATKLKKKYPQFKPYSTSTLNTCIQNAQKIQRKKEASEKKEKKKESNKAKEELTDEERSELTLILLVCCRVVFSPSDRLSLVI